MFTGLIQAVGRLRSSDAYEGGMRWWIDRGELSLDDGQIGESIAISGVCLTVVEMDALGFAMVLSEETLRRSSLGTRVPGDRLNLERAMQAQDRFGGHIVAGHVDGTGQVRSRHSEGASERWWFDAPAELLRYVAVKGSITVDGVSLTVTDVDDGGFAVALIPHTLAATSFGHNRVGDTVNLEVDLIARYVERLLTTARAAN